MSRFAMGLLLAMSFASVQAGQYHVCTDSMGKKTFTSQPCGQGEKAEVKKYNTSSGVGRSEAGSSRLSTDNPIYQRMKSDNRKADIKRAVKKHNKNIEQYSSKMDSELADLKRKKLRANNNGAGATWEVSISEEMNAVTNKYTTMIGIERDRLNDLRSELAGL